MIQRRRTPAGENRDIEWGGGPVGLMPRQTIHGWPVAAAPTKYHAPRPTPRTTAEKRRQQMAEASARYRARRREVAA